STYLFPHPLSLSSSFCLLQLPARRSTLFPYTTLFRSARRRAAPAREPTAQLARCTPATARPDGSAIVAKLASQAIAAGEEQAIDLPPGTVSAAAGVGKWRSNRLRYR